MEEREVTLPHPALGLSQTSEGRVFSNRALCKTAFQTCTFYANHSHAKGKLVLIFLIGDIAHSSQLASGKVGTKPKY